MTLSGVHDPFPLSLFFGVDIQLFLPVLSW